MLYILQRFPNTLIASSSPLWNISGFNMILATKTGATYL